MKDQQLEWTLSENEVIARSYECTQLRKPFAPITTGYLTVTNTRVIYHSFGKSMKGDSCLLAEVPVDDVGGLKMEISNSVNWPALILYLVIAFIGVPFFANILPNFFTNWLFAIILSLPAFFLYLIKKDVFNQEIKVYLLSNPTIKLLQETGNGSSAEEFIRYLGLVGTTILVWVLINRTGLKYDLPGLGTILLIAGYLGVYRLFFGLRRCFSVQILTKSVSGKGISIPGNTLFSFFSDKTATESLNANPAKDAQMLVRELGAIITDIRQSGDIGLHKWTGKKSL